MDNPRTHGRHIVDEIGRLPDAAPGEDFHMVASEARAAIEALRAHDAAALTASDTAKDREIERDANRLLDQAREDFPAGVGDGYCLTWAQASAAVRAALAAVPTDARAEIARLNQGDV